MILKIYQRIKLKNQIYNKQMKKIILKSNKINNELSHIINLKFYNFLK